MATPKEIGKLFLDARENKGLSIEEASQASRIHSNVIMDIESGVFDRLEKLYLKSFMKKYSEFLEMDTDKVLKEYGNISSAIPEREFTLAVEEKEDDDRTALPDIVSNRRFQMVLITLLTLVFFVLLSVFVGMMKSRFSGKAGRRIPAAMVAGKSVSTPVLREGVPSAEKEKPSEREDTLDVSPVKLSLKARGEVWVQIKEGEETLFAGILKKDDSSTWRSNGTLTVWTGKGEDLDFIINGEKVGVIAEGVVKNIQISAQGARVGKSWVIRLD